ncbi:hypothetical protein [Pseudoalteromonas sp. SR44-2]|uniref:hypothetical protein n=1 Tax=Pseudoalteromonas sp. SR44-2 TaxID=2760937 RepID=UPI0015FED293|nr:hypothetical protein [Pseudoalteromonas sp. SR44-2]
MGRHSLSEEQFIKIFSTLSSIIAVLIAYKALNTWKYSEQAKIRAVFVSKIYPQFLKYKKEIDYFAIGFENSDFCNLTDDEESKLACDYLYLIKEVYRLNDFLSAYEGEIILLGSYFFEEYKKYQKAIKNAENNPLIDNSLGKSNISDIQRIRRTLGMVDKLLIKTAQFD